MPSACVAGSCGGLGEIGIEKACDIMMPTLFVILLILMVRCPTLPGAMEGVKFYLYPDFLFSILIYPVAM